jgi:hypothetical protein
MPTVVRFPYPEAQNGKRSEADQIIEIFAASATFPLGGSTPVPVNAWKNPQSPWNECPYSDVVLEFTSNTTPFTLGNGTTDRVGLYGLIDGANQNIVLLGVLGLSLGGSAPQIPFVQRLDAVKIGFAQIVCNVTPFDYLAIGGVSAAIATGGPLITVKARPIRMRDYAG